MAEEVVTLEVKIQAAESANTIKDLTKSLKVLRDEIAKVPQGSEDFKKLAKAINEAEGKVGDITDSFSTLTGSGIERTEKSLGLLREGFTKLDTGKIGLGFKALAGAMSAIPVFLLIEGFNYLRENFEKLSQGSGILARTLRGVGEVIEWLKGGLDILGSAVEIAFGFFQNGIDGIGEAAERIRKEKVAEKLGKELKEAVDSSTESLKLQNAEYDRQIAVAKASGKNAVELEQAKQQAIIDTNKALVEQTIAYVRAGGVLDEERRKTLTEQLEAIKNAKTQQRVIEETFEKEQKDKADKAREERLKKLKEEEEERKKILAQRYQDDADYYANLYKLGVEYAQKRLDYEAQVEKARQEAEAKRAADAKAIKETELANENAFIMADLQSKQQMSFDQQVLALQAERDLKLQNTKLTEQERIAIIQEYDQKEGDLKKQRFDETVNLTAQSLGAAQKLSDMFFAGQLKSAKGNAEKEREIKKKQFNINKAFGITNAVIDGVRSVQAALTQTPPLSYVLAALNAALAVANVAQIASAKFDDTGGGSGASGANAIQGSVGGASAPTIASPNNTVTQIDDKGMINKAKDEEKPQKVYVTEADITEKQKRVSLMENAATL